jgi:hypothetical protein
MILTAKNLAKAYKKRGSIKKAWRFDFPQHAWKTVQKVYTEAVADGVMPVIRPGAKSLESLKHPKKVIEGATGAVKAMETTGACASPSWRETLSLYVRPKQHRHLQAFLGEPSGSAGSL